MIDREKFTAVINSVFGDKVEDLLLKIAKGTRTEDYNLFLQNDTAFIIDTAEEVIINWYKLGHIGRSLQICGGSSAHWESSELEIFLKELKEQLKL